MAMNLFRLAELTGSEELRETAADTLRAFAGRLSNQGPALPAMLSAWMLHLSGRVQVVVAGDPHHETAKAMIATVRTNARRGVALFVPDRHEDDRKRLESWIPPIAAMKPGQGGLPAAYVCRDFTCQAPVFSVVELEELLH
jgi:uncharacterized protein YyaL (SSP411 family)